MEDKLINASHRGCPANVWIIAKCINSEKKKCNLGVTVSKDVISESRVFDILNKIMLYTSIDEIEIQNLYSKSAMKTANRNFTCKYIYNF
jgi:hypothetical protein